MQEHTTNDVIRLYPQPAGAHALKGLYLAHDVRSEAVNRNRPFVYANFVVSLDGRIAVPDRDKGGMKVPPAIANPRDWRLFQELAVQADLVISTGRFLRDYAAGKAQEILKTRKDPAFADLQAWRAEQGLPPQPDLAVVSRSLDFPIPEALREQDRRVIVVTDRRADPERIRRIREQLGEVIVAGDEDSGQGVSGDLFVEVLAAQGYRTVYSAAGPRILHMLLAGGVLDRLYLTFAPRILSGDPFSAIVDGPLLDPPVDMTLRTLYHDGAGLGGLGQLFACYERVG